MQDIARRRNADLYSYVNVAEQLAMQQRIHHNMRRMDAQVDAQLKKCNPDYQAPEEDDMANILVNAGVLVTGADSDTSKQLMQALHGLNGATAPPTAPVQEPAPSSVPVPPPQASSPVAPSPTPVQSAPQQKQSMSAAVVKGAKILAPYLIGAGVSFAAASYLMPDDTDTVSEYSIEAIPFVPPETP